MSQSDNPNVYALDKMTKHRILSMGNKGNYEQCPKYKKKTVQIRKNYQQQTEQKQKKHKTMKHRKKTERTDKTEKNQKKLDKYKTKN